MKILICGGHLTPALSFINYLPKNMEVIYVGRKHALENDTAFSLEYEIIKSRKIRFINLTTGRLQRKISFSFFKFFIKTILGFFISWKILNKEKPDLIIGFGGYISLPLGIISFFKKIPLIIHEQTFKAGLSNRILAIFARRICISWQESARYFPKNKTVLTGNPVLEEFFNQEKVENKIKKILFIGGSQGSHFINNLVKNIVDKLVLNYEIIHQTGDSSQFSDFSKLEKIKNKLSPIYKHHYTLVKFLDPKKIKNIFSSVDVIVSRAGANTVSSLLILNKPAILIPLPFNKSDQTENALFFEKAGLGKVLYQNKIKTDNFLQTLNNFSKNIKNYKLKIAANSLKINQNANRNILKIIYEEIKTNDN